MVLGLRGLLIIGSWYVLAGRDQLWRDLIDRERRRLQGRVELAIESPKMKLTSSHLPIVAAGASAKRAWAVYMWQQQSYRRAGERAKRDVERRQRVYEQRKAYVYACNTQYHDLVTYLLPLLFFVLLALRLDLLLHCNWHAVAVPLYIFFGVRISSCAA